MISLKRGCAWCVIATTVSFLCIGHAIMKVILETIESRGKDSGISVSHFTRSHHFKTFIHY